MTGNKVIFIDVDSVLHPPDESKLPLWATKITEWDFVKPCMAELKKVVDATGAKIIFSSGWFKGTESKATVGQLFKKHGIPSDTFIGSTPEIERYRDCETKRREEILCWLRENPGYLGFVTLDDMDLGLPTDCFIKTDLSKGLTPDVAKQTIAILNGKPNVGKE